MAEGIDPGIAGFVPIGGWEARHWHAGCGEESGGPLSDNRCADVDTNYWARVHLTRSELAPRQWDFRTMPTVLGALVANGALTFKSYLSYK